MSWKNQASLETLKSATAAAITGTYSAVGTPLTAPAVVVSFKNGTNGDVLISTDGTNDKVYLGANSFTIYDIRTNAPQNADYFFAEGTQFYAKDGTTPATTGTLYIEAVIVTGV